MLDLDETGTPRASVAAENSGDGGGAESGAAGDDNEGLLRKKVDAFNRRNYLSAHKYSSFVPSVAYPENVWAATSASSSAPARYAHGLVAILFSGCPARVGVPRSGHIGRRWCCVCARRFVRIACLLRAWLT